MGHHAIFTAHYLQRVSVTFREFRDGAVFRTESTVSAFSHAPVVMVYRVACWYAIMVTTGQLLKCISVILCKVCAAW